MGVVTVPSQCVRQWVWSVGGDVSVVTVSRQ